MRVRRLNYYLYHLVFVGKPSGNHWISLNQLDVIVILPIFVDGSITAIICSFIRVDTTVCNINVNKPPRRRAVFMACQANICLIFLSSQRQILSVDYYHNVVHKQSQSWEGQYDLLQSQSLVVLFALLLKIDFLNKEFIKLIWPRRIAFNNTARRSNIALAASFGGCWTAIFFCVLFY